VEVICILLLARWLVCQEGFLEDGLPQTPHHIGWQTVHDPDKHFRKTLNVVWALKSLHDHLQHHRYALSHEQPGYAQAFGVYTLINLCFRHVGASSSLKNTPNVDCTVWQGA